MTDWTDANLNIDSVYTPNTGPENGNYNYIWRAAWPPNDNTYTWTYFLNNNTHIVGFIEDHPLEGKIGNLNEPNDVRYYITNGWPSNIPFSGLKEPLAEMGTVLTHDNITAGKHEDWLFPGPGNDRVDGNAGADFIAGGSGNDLILGDVHGDILYGDGFNAPVVLDKNFENQVFTWELPTKPDTTVVDGNDQMNGGPRGQGWTDVLTGGGGADAFYLSYTDTDSTNSGTGFWSAWADQYAGDVGENAAKAGVDQLAAAAAADFFESLAGSMLLGGLDTAVGDLASDGIKLLLGMDKSATPKPDGEDVMVVTDFDPREDVLFLPVPTADQNNPATTLTSTPTYFSENGAGANGQTGWGIEFTKGTGNTVFAEVFLAQDFLDAFGVTESSEFANDFIHDVFDTSLVIDENGVQEQQNVYPFPTDPAAYADGVVPVVADSPIAFAAPSGTTTRVFGAFGGLSFLAPTTTTTGVYVSGTNQGDILNVNPASFDPAEATSSGHLTSETSLVMGFAGNDIILGGNGIDVIHGGDGDDWIYGIGHEAVETVETFAGDAGDDLIYLGWTSMSALVDGGDGTDTASFVYVDGTVTADLRTVTTDPLNDPNANSTDDADTLVSNYALTNIENLGGSNNADKLTGDANANILQGNAGSDTLAGGGGSDTASYADNSGKVVVAIAAGTAREYGANGGSQAGTVVSTDSLAGIENATGSAFADSLTGDASDNILQGNAGSDAINGGSGTDTASYAANSGKVTVDLAAGTASEYGPKGSSTAATVVSTDTLTSIEKVIGSPNDDSLTGSDGDDTLTGNAGNDTISGGAGHDTVDFADGASGIHVDLWKEIDGERVGQWIDAFGGSDTVDRASIEAYRGTSAADFMQGDGGGRTNALSLARFYGEGGDDTLYGSGLDDMLDGGDGDDALFEFGGNNQLNGGNGTDTVSYAGYDGKIDADLAAGTVEKYGPAGSSQANMVVFTDTLASIEKIIGSPYDDSLVGDHRANLVDGGDGVDWLYGGNGDDILVSGAGIADVAYGGAGADTHVFGTELANGIRETDIIQDYDPLEDLIDLGGSEIVAHVESTASVVLWAGADQDVIVINGASTLDIIAFLEGTLNQESVA